MLKNFPPFSGNRGIFKGRKNVTFKDSSGCLGSYGLLAPPGEMLFASARLVSEFSSAKKSLSLADMIHFHGALPTGRGIGFPFAWHHPHVHPKEWMFMSEECFDGVGPGSNALSGGLSEFLGNDCFSRDLYDLTRSWTRLSIGEPTCIANEIVNQSVDAFANFLLRSAGLGDHARFPPDELFIDRQFEGQMGILAIHLDVE